MANEGRFQFDPLTGAGTVTYNNGTSADMALEQWSGGRFTVQRQGNGSVVVDTLNSFNRTPIGIQGPAAMEFIPGIGYSTISESLQGTANRTISAQSMRIASGAITINLPGGALGEFGFENVPIAPAGYQWAAYIDYDGSTRFARVPAIYGTDAQLKSAYTDRWRLATLEEVIMNAAAYKIASDPDFWSQVALLESQMGDLPEDADNYEIAQFLLIQAGSIRDLQIFQHTVIE